MNLIAKHCRPISSEKIAVRRLTISFAPSAEPCFTHTLCTTSTLNNKRNLVFSIIYFEEALLRKKQR